MGKSISLDIAALILLTILFISCILRKMTGGISNRIFLITMFTAIVSAVFDIAAVSLDNAHSSNVYALYTAHAGYLISHYLSAPFHLLFVISLTDTWHKLRKNYALQIFLIIPFVVIMTAFIANAGNQLVFSVENGYERGPLFVLLYLTTVMYIVCDIIYIIRYRKLFDFNKILAVSATIPIGMTAMLIQMFLPNILIEMFVGALSFLIISMGIQRPEDYIDSFTRLMKFRAYVYDMERTYYNKKHVKVIMLNIGNFRTIQNMIGFDSTMQVLKDIADKMREINKKMHGYADLYYLDNGRFRIVFSGKYMKEAEGVAEALNEDLKSYTRVNGLEISLAPFIVLALCPEEIANFGLLMSFGADFHLKNQYTGQVMKAGELYSRTQMDIQSNIDAIIERALENESFQVYYQPIYSLSQDKFISAEALIRLFDPQYGSISPETLIIAAEKNGTIHKIGEVVFEKVCQFIASDNFKKLGIDYIEINLSVAQIMNGDLPDTLFSIMKKYNVSSDKINLEITETATAYSQKIMTENLEKLTKAGIKFSLDDYGTGYSNMKRVIQLPLKIIKLDKSFVNEDNNPKLWIFLRNTIKMLKDMNMEIVIEGVETQEMLDAFTDLKCDYIQGYFFSKPIPESDFVVFITNANMVS